MSRSLVRTLSASTWIIAAIGVVSASLITVYLLLHNEEERAMERLRVETANLLSLGLKDLIALNQVRDILTELPGAFEGKKLNEYIHVYDPTGRLIYSNADIADLKDIPFFRSERLDKTYYVIHGNRYQYLALLNSYRTQRGGTIWVEVFTRKTSAGELLQQIITPFMVVLLLLIGLAYIVTHLVTERAFRPFKKRAADIGEIDLQHLKAWEPLSTDDQPDELMPLIRKVNELMMRIQSSLLNAQYMGRYIAHEVRTPLTIMQGEIETALDKDERSRRELEDVLRTVLEEISKIDEIIRSILRLSSESRRATAYDPRPINLSEVIALFHEHQTALNVTLSLSPTTHQPATLFGDWELFRLLISNLLRNISQHGGPSPIATIAISTKTNGNILIDISDRGPGLPQEMIDALNQGKWIEGQVGIGLILCLQIAQITNLSLQFENVGPQGLRTRIECPKAH